MAKHSESVSDARVLSQREMAEAFARLEAQEKQDREASLAILYEKRREERRERRYDWLVSYWPVGVGLAISALAPLIWDLAHRVGSWTNALVFPFVVLAERPEIQVGPITHLLPAIMLYAQFPLEGYLARLILRRRVHPLGVAGQVLLFHFLGIVELWLLSDGARAFFERL